MTVIIGYQGYSGKLNEQEAENMKKQDYSTMKIN